ncbi:hypothetical protein CVT26_008601 [Gymnopilus dilepis]|uniref:Uncharacterized protein n=1 Tax=Gymnopilus dilepis TaxID=231916 RepID=A0A409XXW8_9AGAR|nr:hypothetical protein CVT26_008601 [Gymnopilus dilepis]
MSSSGHPLNLLGRDGRDEARPRLLSLPDMNQNTQQSRPPLESRHLNGTQEPSDLRSLFAAQKAPRFSLSGLSTNPPRMSTPMQPRASLQYESAPARRGEQSENGASSPLGMPTSSPERAYMQPNRRISPPPSSRRLSLLHLSQARPPRSDATQHIPPATPQIPVTEATEDMTLTTLSSALSRYQHVVSENERLNALCNQSALELASSRARLSAATRELETANSEVAKLQPALASCKEAIVAKDTELASVKPSLVEVKSELASLKEGHITVVEERNDLLRQKEATGKILANAKEKMVSLVKEYRISLLSEFLRYSWLKSSYATLGESYKELKKTHEQSQRQLLDLSQEVQETKKLAKNGMAAVQPLLDDDNTLARAAQTKAILQELEQDLTSTHQVNDLLRDKLQVSGSQLIDAQGRIRELEEEKRGALQQLLSAREEEKRQFELLILVENKVAQLSERLSAREKEAFDVLANSAALEADLQRARAEIETFRANEEAHVAELTTLRVVKEEHLSKLLALQDIINAREKEAISLRGDVKALNESKAELRALLAESKKELAQKFMELQEKNPNEDLLGRVYDLQAKKEVLTAKVVDLEERNRALASSLKDAQGQYVGLQQASRDQEAAFRAAERSDRELTALRDSLKEAQDSLKKALVASGKCQGLEDEVMTLKDRLNVQSVSLFQSKEEVTVLKERVNSLTNQLRVAQPASEEAATLRERLKSVSAQLNRHEADNEVLKNAQEKRASTAEASAAFLQSRLAESEKALQEMKFRVSELTHELSGMKEASIIMENENETMVHHQKANEQAMNELERGLVALQQENDGLRKELGGILERFEGGRLNSSEKELVRRLMDDSRRIHEEEVVRKDNELRRRQHAVDSLKAKVVELQGTIARMIKEKDKEPQAMVGETTATNKPIVGLNAWMSSSPRMESAAASKEIDMLDVTRDEGLSTSPAVIQQAPPPSGLPADPKLSDLQTADFDEDDDKPLSELSNLSELDEVAAGRGPTGQDKGKARDLAKVAVGNKRMRSPSPQGVNLSHSSVKKRLGANAGAQQKPSIPQKEQAPPAPVSASGPNGAKKVSITFPLSILRPFYLDGCCAVVFT